MEGGLSSVATLLVTEARPPAGWPSRPADSGRGLIVGPPRRGSRAAKPVSTSEAVGGSRSDPEGGDRSGPGGRRDPCRGARLGGADLPRWQDPDGGPRGPDGGAGGGSVRGRHPAAGKDRLFGARRRRG